METLVRCGGCGEPPVDVPLRRGRCTRCFELGVRGNAPGGRWIVLCHNCVAAAVKMEPQPRSLDGLKMRLARERRWGDRRAEAVGRPSVRAAKQERRDG